MERSDQFNIFDVLGVDGELTLQTVSDTLNIEPKVDEHEMAAAAMGLMPMRPNYVRLGWYRAGSTPHKTVFSAKWAQVDKRDPHFNQKTLYLIPVPLPVAWLEDESCHAKALLYEKRELAKLGFAVSSWPFVEQSTWEILNPILASEWQVEHCLCPVCFWLNSECVCSKTGSTS